MKNLKKILLAVLVLALIASVAVITVIADDGALTIEDANKLWAAYTEAMTPADKEAALVDFYAFVAEGELPDDTEGYEALKTQYDEATFAVAKSYYEANKLVDLYAYMAKAPVIKTSNVDGYDQFVIDYNVASVNMAVGFLQSNYASVASLNETIKAYYDYMAAREFLTYVAPAAPTEYTGEITAATARLEAVTAEKDLAAKKTAFAALYEYVVTVDPTLEGYAEFKTAYDAECEAMTTALMDSVIVEADLVGVKEYIVETPYAESAYNAYNAKVNMIAAPKANSAITRGKTLNTGYQDFYNHLSLCPIDETKLPTDAKAKYKLALTQADEVEAAIIYSYVVQYESLGEIVESTAAGGLHLQKMAFYDQLNALVKSYPFGFTTPNYNTVMAKVADAKADKEARVEAQMYAADYDTDLGEYSLDYGAGSDKCVSYDFQDKTSPPWTFYHGDTNKGTNTGTDLYVHQTEDGNKYLDFIYGTSTEAYIDFPIKDSTEGIVLEFDIATFSDSTKPSLHLQVAEDGLNPDGSKTGNRQFPCFIRIANGVFQSGPDRKALTGNLFTKGEWVHVTVAYDPVDVTCTLYVNYVNLGTWSVKSAELYRLTTFRFSSNGTAGQSYAIDNMVTYVGTAFRVPDKFERMSDEEKFNFYVNYAYDQGKLPADRNYAYNESLKLYDSVKESQNAETVESVAKFEVFDYNKHILEPARAKNLAELGTLVTSLTSTPVDSANNEAKRVEAESIETFIGNCGNYINRSESQFIEYKNTIAYVKSECDRLTNVEQFIYYLQRFNRATTFASMQTYAVAADEYYKLCQFTDGGEEDYYYNLVKEDAAVVAMDAATKQKNMVEYYLSFGDLMKARTKYENSYRIIDCMSFVLELEGYENTEEFWSNNFDYINKYVLIVRDIVRTNNYDPTYEGVSEAIDAFEIIDAHFYDLLQDRHVINIKAQLDKYPLTDSYIEKIGVVRYVSDYLEANDVDGTRADVAELLFLHSVYANEVEIHKEEYASILVQNTTYFVYTVERMGAYVTYAELKPLYEEALTYYYSMNLETDEAVAAMAKFHEYEKMLTAAEVSGAIFIGAVDVLENADDMGETYVALVVCQHYVADVDKSIDGVSEAVATYEAALAEYTATVNAANAQIDEANGVSCSVRTVSIAEVILATFKSIFTR